MGSLDRYTIGYIGVENAVMTQQVNTWFSQETSQANPICADNPRGIIFHAPPGPPRDASFSSALYGRPCDCGRSGQTG